MIRKRWDAVLDRLPHHAATVVEVGVWRGALALSLLQARPQLQLVLVDPWLAGANNPIWSVSGATLAQRTQAEMDAIYADVVARTRPYAARVRILRIPSVEAAAQITDGSCEAVFLDAVHSLDSVTEDIHAWLPKVRPGGWIGGHDYRAPRFPGVTEAVHAAFPVVDHDADSTWFARAA